MHRKVQQPIDIAILVYQGLLPFEFSMVHELLVRTSPGEGKPWYRCRTVSLEGKRVAGLAGLTLLADTGTSGLASVQTIIIPGWRDPAERPPTHMLKALRDAHGRGTRIMTICTGAFVLAHAGLLDGRPATTHWLHAPRLMADFPAIKVNSDVLYVDLGDIITSAGNAAGLDALLHMIRKDFSGEAANTIARRVVVQPHREGGQAQYVQTPVLPRPGRGVSAAVDWARKRLAEEIGLADLAKAAAMSERTLHRRFQKAIGMSPGEWLQQERVNRARSLLESSELPLADVAQQCGYQSFDTFRIAFRRMAGVAPATYRKQFSGKLRNQFTKLRRTGSVRTLAGGAPSVRRGTATGPRESR